MSTKKVPVLDVMIDSVTMDEAVKIIAKYMKQQKNFLVATANAEMIMMAHKDKELRDILNRADLVVPDGAGTVWAARHLGFAMPERVAGYDLVQRLLACAPKARTRIFFLGSAPGVALKAKEAAEKKNPGIQIVGIRDGYFTADEEDDVIEAIRKTKPDLLLVALGVPRQEKWIAKYKSRLQVPVAIGVGGTLDVMAGIVKRAPVWMQRAKMEWLYRGVLQPKRMGRLIALPKFVFKVRSCKKH